MINASGSSSQSSSTVQDVDRALLGAIKAAVSSFGTLGMNCSLRRCAAGSCSAFVSSPGNLKASPDCGRTGCAGEQAHHRPAGLSHFAHSSRKPSTKDSEHNRSN